MFKALVHLFLIGSLAAAVWKPDDKPAVQTLSDRIANYQIQVSLDNQHKILHGSETAEWKNPGKAPVSELYFHLYPNAFESERTTFMTERIKEGFLKALPNDAAGFMKIERIEAGQERSLMDQMQFVQPDDGNAQDRTLLKVQLPDPVPPAGTIKLFLQFTVQLPPLHRRMGYAAISLWPANGSRKSPYTSRAAREAGCRKAGTCINIMRTPSFTPISVPMTYS
ncbi:hypothetical protein [Gordoniibacillus kamchatkensis]|uniref:hypothetical protein n=1 Tax=Gordoniibacillus kamchatkensis TaxID=1590651 RepID=UPI000696087D|nr:hypothetical protein [Paenibacillus sp. VKM B-2647]